MEHCQLLFLIINCQLSDKFRSLSCIIMYVHQFDSVYCTKHQKCIFCFVCRYWWIATIKYICHVPLNHWPCQSVSIFEEIIGWFDLWDSCPDFTLSPHRIFVMCWNRISRRPLLYDRTYEVISRHVPINCIPLRRHKHDHIMWGLTADSLLATAQHCFT